VNKRISILSSSKTHCCLDIQNNIMVCNFIVLGMMDHKHYIFPWVKRKGEDVRIVREPVDFQVR
jgi:hypothetical protein